MSLSTCGCNRPRETPVGFQKGNILPKMGSGSFSMFDSRCASSWWRKKERLPSWRRGCESRTAKLASRLARELLASCCSMHRFSQHIERTASGEELSYSRSLASSSAILGPVALQCNGPSSHFGCALSPKRSHRERGCRTTFTFTALEHSAGRCC